MKTEKFKVTPLERAWILYDVGNSAFVLMIATLVPIFFNALAEAGGVSKVDYLAYWGYASSIVTVVTAILGPILGTLADTKGFKKPIFMLCLFVGVIGCCAMGLAGTWLAFLVIFIIAKIGYSGSLVFYDSMLGDVTTPERMDMVSSRGYAWGYIGSCVPFVVCLALVLGSSAVGLSQMTALSIALVITAVWWLVVTLPLLKKYRQINYVEVEQHAIRQSFVRIGQTLKHLPQDKQVFWFLLAFFCYIDGVYTIIDMATAYGTALGLDTTGLLLALLVAPFVNIIPAMSQGPMINRRHAEMLSRAQTVVPKDATLWLWWDWGYAAHHFAHRLTIADGARNAGAPLYLSAAVLGTDNPRFARQLIRYTSQFAKGRDPFDEEVASEVFAGLDAQQAQDLMDKLRSPETALVEGEGRQFVTVSFEMLRLGFWISNFGNWDFVTRQGEGAALSILPQAVAYNLDKGEVLLDDSATPIRPASISVFEETGVTRRDYIQQWFDSHPRATAAQRQEFLSGRRNVHFFFNRITDEKLAMDANLYNSLMVRLLVGNPQDPAISPYFKLVYDNVFCRIYEVL